MTPGRSCRQRRWAGRWRPPPARRAGRRSANISGAACEVGARQMIADALDGAIAIVIKSEHRGARHQTDIGQALQLGQASGHEVQRGEPSMAVFSTEQPSAETKILFGEDDASARAASGQRRHQPRRAGADHQHVATGLHLLVMIGIGKLRRATKTRGLADRRFIKLLPRGFRPHESLVVESRAEKGREQAVDRQHIEIERGPAILAQRVEAVVKLGGRRAGIGLAPRAITQFDQRIRLLGPLPTMPRGR